MADQDWGLTARELRLLRGLKTPFGVQRFLDQEVLYNKELDGVPTCRSPRRVIRDRTGHCMEGALFGAAALRVLGYPPILVDLASVRDDDHVLAVFRHGDCWGAVAKSNYTGLRFREPIYRSLRELAVSYFEHYYNLRGEKTLRGYSRPINLRRFDRIAWMIAEEDVWAVPQYLVTVSHTTLLSRQSVRRLNPMDRRAFEAGQYGGI